MKPPIYTALMKYVSRQRTKFTTPGHKGKIRMKTDNLCRIDVDDIIDTNDNTTLSQLIKKSEEEISGIFGASKSYYLTSGISSGIYASLASLCSPGDKVIIDPEAGKAIINAITILALQPVFLKRSYLEKYSLSGGISTEVLENTIMEANDAKLVILSSPTYYGVVANIKKAVAIAHENKMLVMVDESYGVHFNFAKAAPSTALECGADIVVHSLSKTLGGFSGSGLLHLAQTIDEAATGTIEANLDVYQEDSKSSAFVCAAENIIHYAFTNQKKFNIIYKELDRAKQIINMKTDILWFDVEENNGCDINIVDKLKIVLNFSRVEQSGAYVAQLLKSKYAIEPDYADEDNIVFSVSLYNTASEIRKLTNSILSISKFLIPVDSPEATQLEFGTELFDEGPRVVMSPYKAFYCNGEWVDIKDAAGKICRKTISKLPQGTAVIVPGEKISSDMIYTIKELQKNNVKLNGVREDNKIEVLSLSDSFYF